jgi:hypothetical protein
VGVVIRSASELSEISHLLTNQKIIELATNIDEVNPKKREATTTSSSDIFDI